MAKKYWLRFGSGDPTDNAGLAPTFIHFVNAVDGSTLSPPGITQLISGLGLYTFEYAPTFSIAFVADGATTGLDASDRYIYGALDPLQDIDNRLGDANSAIGTTNTDPTTAFGMLKRAQEVVEGNAEFTKSSGAWEIKTRGGTLLATKTLANTASQVTKS